MKKVVWIGAALCVVVGIAVYVVLTRVPTLRVLKWDTTLDIRGATGGTRLAEESAAKRDMFLRVSVQLSGRPPWRDTGGGMGSFKASQFHLITSDGHDFAAAGFGDGVYGALYSTLRSDMVFNDVVFIVNEKDLSGGDPTLKIEGCAPVPLTGDTKKP